MRMTARLRLLVAILPLAISPLASAQGTPADYGRADGLRERMRDKVSRASVQPHWLGESGRFWYRNRLAGGASEFILVDAARAERKPAFDHAKLAEALAKASGSSAQADRLPFEEIAVDDDGAIRFAAGGKGWRFDPAAGTIAEAEAPMPAASDEPERQNRARGGRRPGMNRGLESPDGKWTAVVRDHNVFVREKSGQEEIPLSREGTEDDGYEPWVAWSPDSKKLVAMRTAKAQEHPVHFVESSPKDQLQPRLHAADYLKPGDRIAVRKPHLFDVEARKEIPVSDELFPTPWSIEEIRWAPDSSRFTFVYNQRGHQALRVIAVDAADGKARAIIDEQSKTFIDYAHKQFKQDIDETNEIVWMSERSGWNHLYLIDARDGAVKSPITQGEWVVRGVERVDPEKRQVWFRAGGIHPGQDPYHVHFARANFDGTDLVLLTEGNGTHQVEFSPDRRFFVDTYSRVDLPPVAELRRSEDGKLIRELERADTAPLIAAGWKAPERFVAKGRDGATDIHGVIFRPTNFDPSKSYPVIEQIYAGPQGAFVPKGFAPIHGPQALAELGFILVQIDGMGTNWRSKAFHDVCWKNLADSGFPDRIAWMKAAAAKYPQMDLARVGIYGGSAGGQSALGALLFHGDFYKAAAADCGCHDNRMDKIWWNELWMGWPVGPHYEEQSNVANAHRLTGKLLLLVGEMDRNVDPASTMQVADALIKAGKDFELVVLPGADHGAGSGPYGIRRQRDFFARHLLGTQPPDRNRAADAPPAIVARAPGGAAVSPAPPASMRELIEQHTADEGSLRRTYRAALSPGRSKRMRAFFDETLKSLETIDFAGLDLAGRVDYLLLKNEAAHQLRRLDAQAKSDAEVAPLVPFAPAIVALADSLRQMEPVEPAKSAAMLDELGKEIERLRKVEGPRPSPALALRAAKAVDGLRGSLREWFAFSDGYDPIFSWWNRQPFQAADKALYDYGVSLRGDKPGEQPSSSSAIVGNPIGREALLNDLRHAMIPYTPEELIAIAEREFAWCEAEMKRASAEMGLGDDWKAALERVKTHHVGPGEQPALIRELADEAIAFLDARGLITIPPLARESWRMEMMTPQRQLVNPFFTGGEVISVSFPADTMTHEQKLMSMRGNNRHFARATVHHELIPGHHLQVFMMDRHRPYRQAFRTPFWVEGWALYWEILFWDLGYPKTPEDRVGALFWRSHRCARILFSLKFHLGRMTPQECIDFLVDRVGHERDNATAEVRRSFNGDYSPLYQCAYMLGGLQIRALRRELVESGKMTDRAFHDAILRENAIPIELIRASLSGTELAPDYTPSWRFDEAARR